MQRSSRLSIAIITLGVIALIFILTLERLSTFFFGNNDDVMVAPTAELSSTIESVSITPTSTPTLIPTRITTDEGDFGTGNPRFGEICFDTFPADGLPTKCTETALSVNELHAFFDYDGMSADDTWLRVWSYEGKEVLRVEEFWAGEVEGRFDYNLNTSTGQPIIPGEWALALYINDAFQTEATFTIQELTPTATPVPTPVPRRPDYTLAFTKWDGSKHTIWTAKLDGSNQQFLLDYAASPSWGPDGNSLTFYGEEGIDNQPALEVGTNGIWRMGAKGENPTQLLADGSVQSVAWSPNGNLIAFDAARGDADRRLYFIDLGGNAQAYDTFGEQVAWSPDGSQIVAKACRPQCGLWISRPDNGGARQLTDEGTDGLPAWSPDGSKIVFSRNVNSNVDLYVIGSNGSGLRRLTTATGNDSVPTWTPDGREIVFRSTRNGLWQIFIMGAAGSNQRPIISDVGAGNEWAFDRMSVR
ncbi:MAG: hypothetical protein AAF629_36875 [Chloroflexota bacterium]